MGSFLSFTKIVEKELMSYFDELVMETVVCSGVGVGVGVVVSSSSSPQAVKLKVSISIIKIVVNLESCFIL